MRTILINYSLIQNIVLKDLELACLSCTKFRTWLAHLLFRAYFDLGFLEPNCSCLFDYYLLY